MHTYTKISVNCLIANVKSLDWRFRSNFSTTDQAMIAKFAALSGTIRLKLAGYDSDIGIPAKRRQKEQNFIFRATGKSWVYFRLMQLPSAESLILPFPRCAHIFLVEVTAKQLHSSQICIEMYFKIICGLSFYSSTFVEEHSVCGIAAKIRAGRQDS